MLRLRTLFDAGKKPVTAQNSGQLCISTSDIAQQLHLNVLAVQPTELAVPDSAAPLIASFVTSAREIAQYEKFVRGLASEPGMLSPRFFLATVSSFGWRPLLIVVREGPRVAGLLYCKERVVAGIGIRMAFANDDLGTMIVARPEDRQAVMVCGATALLRRMVALRFVVPPAYLPVLKSIPTCADFSFYRAQHHAHLELPANFEHFLLRLGPRTRRNFRYYRRKSEQAGNEFVPVLARPDFFSAAERLLPNAAYATAASKEMQARYRAMIEAMPLPILAGLRRPNGEWISLAGGWSVGQRAFLVMQLNDRGCERESVSIVLRSYLIETLINSGCRELVFWGGSSAPLNVYATYPEAFMVSLNAPSLPLRIGKRAWAMTRTIAPVTFGRLLNSFVRGL